MITSSKVMAAIACLPIGLRLAIQPLLHHAGHLMSPHLGAIKPLRDEPQLDTAGGIDSTLFQGHSRSAYCRPRQKFCLSRTAVGGMPQENQTCHARKAPLRGVREHTR